MIQSIVQSIVHSPGFTPTLPGTATSQANEVVCQEKASKKEWRQVVEKFSRDRKRGQILVCVYKIMLHCKVDVSWNADTNLHHTV